MAEMDWGEQKKRMETGLTALPCLYNPDANSRASRRKRGIAVMCVNTWGRGKEKRGKESRSWTRIRLLGRKKRRRLTRATMHEDKKVMVFLPKTRSGSLSAAPTLTVGLRVDQFSSGEKASLWVREKPQGDPRSAFAKKNPQIGV